MNPVPDPNQELEQWVGKTLRELPPRRAPRSLEQRVLAELDRRAALPWWRKSFGHWPIGARAAFVLLCAGLVRVALMAGAWMMAGFDPASFKSAFAQPYALMEGGIAIVNAVSGFCDIMLRNIPSLWIYGGLVFFAAMYAALFGLGAAAYKALHARE
jgi:hypothetical protein